jgi:class 3 adenylate cyclase/tetratricopeptide (TPR) repeat protein
LTAVDPLGVGPIVRRHREIGQNRPSKEGSMTASSFCSQCGFALAPQARFCSQCGTRVEAAPGETAATSIAAGERRQVAILFADLSGYTRLSRAQDPEETHKLLTRFFELVDGVIERLGGNVDKHIGDAVMGVFGAPIAYGNDVERAMRAAAAIHEGMARLAADSRVQLGTHIGIASGEVVAGATGSAVHRDYTVTGDAVNLAARLTDLARLGETVISEGVQRASAGVAETVPLGSVAIRGLTEAVSAWKVTAVHASTRDAKPLIGREAERARFASLIKGAKRDGNGAIALVRADPGMGKSRLSEALIRDAQDAGVRCHLAAILDFGVARGQDALQALVSSLLGIPGTANDTERRAGLQRALDAGLASVEDEAYLADWLLLSQRTEMHYDAIDAETRRAGKLRALANVAASAARSDVCVLLIDDVHWASDWVLAGLRSLADVTLQVPLVLLMTTRRDGDPISGRWSAENIVRFELAPLSHDEALALARLHLAGTPTVAERCVERAQGNPLFLMQLLRSDADEDSIPPTIQSVVLARLDRLNAADKAAMQAAAVIGLRFPLELLRHLVDDARYVPATPVTRDLLRNDERDPRFMLFTHALIRDGAYASLLHTSRRALHERAALWYETRDAKLFAEHLDRAESPRAADAYLACARSEAAAMRTETALALATRGSELPSSSETQFALAILAGELQAELGRADASIVAYERAVSLAQDDPQHAQAWIGVALAYRMQTAVSKGLAALDNAERHAMAGNLVRKRARIEYLRGSFHFASGDATACREHHERARDLAHQTGDAECEAQALSGLADALYAQGKLRSSRDAFLHCLDICERLGLTRFSLMNHCMVAIIDAHFGRIDDALARFDRARALARDVRHRVAETMCDESSAWILVFTGRLRDALEPVLRGLSLARASGARRFEVVLLVSLAKIRSAEGAHEEAQARVREAWDVSDQVGARFAGPMVLGAMAELAVDDTERARALGQGERLLREECVSHCYFGFYQSAIEVSLRRHDWNGAERYANLLDEYARDEPLPIIDFLVARAKALIASGRGNADRQALEACREYAKNARMTAYLPAIEAALKSSGL